MTSRMRLSGFRQRLSYANVASTLALFIALGGASYAAIKLPKDSVGGRQIKAGAVKAGDLADGAVKASKLKAGAVGSGSLAPGAVTADKLVGGAVGHAALAGDAVDSGNIVDGSIAAGDLAPIESPHDVTLQPCDATHDWTAAGGLDPHYWLDRDGMVHLEGAVSCAGTATAGSLIFSMPAAYRPAEDVVRFGVLGGGQSVAQVAAVINTFDAGFVYDAGSSGTTSDDYVSLEGITYRAGG
jgi:hypothetical protein